MKAPICPGQGLQEKKRRFRVLFLTSQPAAFRRQDAPQKQHRRPCQHGQHPRSILLGAAAAYAFCLRTNPKGARRHGKPGFPLQVRRKARGILVKLLAFCTQNSS
eukprot:s6679_g5.t1